MLAIAIASTSGLVFDMPRRYARIFNRCDPRDLCLAQAAGLVEVLRDNYDPYAAFDLELRIALVGALRTIGRWRA